MGAQKYFSSAAAESACRQYRVVREALLSEAELRQRQRGICPSGGKSGWTESGPDGSGRYSAFASSMVKWRMMGSSFTVL